MHIDEWLQQCHDEKTKEAAPDLNEVFSWMGPDDLIKVANGETTVDEVLERMVSGEQTKEAASVKQKAKFFLSGVAGAPKLLAEIGGDTVRHVKKKIKGLTKTSEAKLVFMDKVARQIAREHYEVAQELEKEGRSKNVTKQLSRLADRYGWGRGGPHVTDKVRRVAARGEARIHGWMGERGLGREARKFSKGMTKSDEFTSPEAQQKAKVMQTAMKATKGAPPKVRKAAVKQVGTKIASIKIAVGDTPKGQKALRALGQNLVKKKKELAAAGLAGKTPSRQAIEAGAKMTKRIGRVLARLK